VDRLDQADLRLYSRRLAATLCRSHASEEAGELQASSGCCHQLVAVWQPHRQQQLVRSTQLREQPQLDKQLDHKVHLRWVVDYRRTDVSP
jgi:hypothetical protein